MKIYRRIIVSTILMSFVCNIFFAAYGEEEYKKSIEDKKIQETFNKAISMSLPEEKMKDIMSDGLSEEDAKYYLIIDNLVKVLEKEEMQINLEEYISNISNEDFAGNKEYYREKILQGDRSSLRKALESLNNLAQYNSDGEKLVNNFQDNDSYEIVYEDGSKLKYTCKYREENERGVLNGDNFHEKAYCCEINEDGYVETPMESGITYAYDKVGAREAQWSFQSGLSYSKVYLYTEFYLGKDMKSYITYARGGQSSYGVVNIANSTGATISRNFSEGENFPAEARNEVVFTVTGSFGANFLILSMAANPGLNWTQYIIFRLNDVEKMGENVYGAHYNWAAAQYQ